MSFETGGALGKFLRMPATAKNLRLESARLREGLPEEISGVFSSERFRLKIEAEDRIFAATTNKLKKIAEFSTGQRSYEDRPGVDYVEVQTRPLSVEEARKSRQTLQAELANLPKRVSGMEESIKNSIEGRISGLSEALKGLTLRSPEDIIRMNELLTEIETEISIARDQKDYIEGVNDEVERKRFLIQRKALEEAGFSTHGGLSQAYKKVHERVSSIARRQFELRGVINFIRNKQELEALRQEMKKLSEISSLGHIPVYLRTIFLGTLERDIDEVIADVVLTASEKIFEYEDGVLRETGVTKLDSEEDPPVLDQVTLRALDRQYGEQIVISEIADYLERYSREESEEGKAGILEDVRTILRAVSESSPVEHSILYKAGQGIIEEGVEVPEFVKRLAALPSGMRSILDRKISGQFGANRRFIDMAKNVREYSVFEQRELALVAYRKIIEDVREAAVEASKIPGISYRVGFIGAKEGELSGLEPQAIVDRQLQEFDQERWKVFKSNPKARALMPEGAVEAFDSAIGNTILARLLKSKPHDSHTINLGYELLDYKSSGIVPIVILNAFRETGSSGEYPFISRNQKDSDTLLCKYIAKLTPEDIDSLKASGVPGLLETVLLIRDYPDSFRGPETWNSETRRQEINPVGHEVRKNMLKMVAHYLEKGDPQTKFFVLATIQRWESVPSEIHSLIEKSMRDASIERTSFRAEAIDVLGNRVKYYSDEQALRSLGNIISEFGTEPEALLAISELVEVGDSIARKIAELKSYVGREDSLQTKFNLRDVFGSVGADLLRKAPEMQPGIIVGLLKAFDKSGLNPVQLSEFIKSDYLKGNLALLFAVPAAGKEFTDVLINRLKNFGDEDSFLLLTSAMRAIEDPAVRKSVSVTLAEFIAGTDYRSNEPDPFRIKVLDRIVKLASGKDLLLQRQAVQILSLISAQSFVMDPEGAKFGGKKRINFYSRIRARVENVLNRKLKSNDDPIIRFYSYVIEGNLGLEQVAQTEYLTQILIQIGNLDQYEPGSLETILNMAKMYAGEFSNEQVKKLLGAEKIGGELLKLFSLHNKLDASDEEVCLRILVSTGNGIKLANESVSYLLDGIERVTEENWIRALVTYVIVKGNEGIRISNDQRNKILGLFEDPAVKDLCLRQLRKLWQGYLENTERESLPLQALILSEVVKDADIPPNLRFIESYANLINKVSSHFAESTTAKRTKKEIKEGLLKQERRFQKERFSEDDRANFSDISADIIEAAPSLFAEFTALMEQFSPEEMKIFMRELYPFYQAQLVILQKGDSKYDPRQLVALRENIRIFGVGLYQAGGDTDLRRKIFADEKKKIVEFLHTGFKERFGLLKIPDVLDLEKIRSIQNCIRYLGNISKRNTESETLIAFMLGLQLSDQWQAFRRGEAVKASEYFEEDKLRLIEKYLSEKARLDQISAEKLGLSSEEYREFMAILQDESLNAITGNVLTIDQKLGNILRNLEALEDPDVYAGTSDGEILKMLREEGKVVSAVLAKLWQIKSGKNIPMSDEERAVLERITSIPGVDLSSTEKIKALQDRSAPLRMIASVLGYVEEQGISEQITELQSRLKPSDEIGRIFNSLGEEFTPHSGALALSQDLMYLENIIVKNDSKLSASDKEKLNAYLGSIREQMVKMESSLQEITARFEQVKKSGGSSSNERLKFRLSEIDRVIHTRDEVTSIISRVTIDPNLIIENMRQCLGMMTREINNDTNLTFLDADKFFVMSQTTGDRKSISDQIVFFIPVGEGGEGRAFVMDQIYGSKSSDIMLNHTLAILKKYRQLQERFPGLNLSVFVTSAAMSSGGISSEILRQKVVEQVGDRFIFEESQNVKVNVPESASGDHYVEFGGGTRQPGSREISGVIIRLKLPAQVSVAA